MRCSKYFFVLLIVSLFLLTACGQNNEPVASDDGEEMNTCLECHTDQDKLLADLAANPLPEKQEAESEGEG